MSNLSSCRVFQGYRSCAQRASILFFVLNDMGRIDPMYQFSLDAYIDLFNQSIEKSQKSPQLDIRIQNMNEYHTYAVYRSVTSVGLMQRYSDPRCYSSPALSSPFLSCACLLSDMSA